jgi:hypothetical protein
MKIFPDGSTGLNWREAKGKTPINIKECKEQYHKWWWEWGYGVWGAWCVQ